MDRGDLWGKSVETCGVSPWTSNMCGDLVDKNERELRSCLLTEEGKAFSYFD